MATTDDLVTLVCLFHHQDQAQAVIKDLLQAGVPQSSISVIGDSGEEADRLGGSSFGGSSFGGSSLDQLGVPERDQRHLLDGIDNGGVVVAVSAVSDRADKIEDIFENHRATKIDDVASDDPTGHAAPLAGAATAIGLSRGGAKAESAIPIVEEELVVGKQTVDQGGVLVYRRVVEIPVEQSVNLREEHVTVERRHVDRPVTEEDLALQGDRTIELNETVEEAVISKSARVVEEVHVGKESTERTERIHDTVRRTEVEVEEIGREGDRDALRRDL